MSGFTWAEISSSALIIPKGILSISLYPALPLELNDIDGKSFNLAQEKGRWAFVYF